MSQTSPKSKRPSVPGTPRWVKVFGIIGIVLISVFAILHLTGNSPFGDHMAMIQQWWQQLWR
jgi:hypothetical protein